ncbi:MAG: FtsX-like permease family protein [Actinobacteria bacterium]|nr:FtsX-like permease family protein [Actinomycetota bacterium]
MTKFAIKGLLTRKLRTALTALAIVLGVAMISGTYVLTDSIDSAFDQIFTDVRQGSDVVVTGKSAFDLSEGSGVTEPTLDEALLDEIRGLDGVEQAEGSVDSESTSLIGKDGKAIVFGGAPNLGFAIPAGESTFNPLRLVEGAWPGPDEVVIDSGVADKKDFAIGDRIGVQVEGPVSQLRISGIVEFGSDLSIGGATLAGFELATAQRLFEKEGRLDEIAIAGDPGVSTQALLAEINPILPEGAQAVTGAAQAEEDASETNEFITFLRGFLLAFGGIALFVGSFVIANSLSITIAQRMREFATLRTLGASRRQVLTSVILESLVVGVVASVIGLFLGLLLAKGLFALFDIVGFTLPNTGLLFQTRTVVVALLAGVVVTLLASLRPAFRATRVPPIAAVREGATIPETRFARLRGLGAALTAVAGFASLLYGLFGPDLGTTQILVWMGLGALLIFLGVALFSSRLVRPLARLLGWPATRIGGTAGSLARDNAQRNPQRTASTAAALMIGLALVTLVATLAAGIVNSFKGAVNDLFTGDYAITAQNNFSPIPTAAAEAAAQASGVTAVGNVRTGEVRVFGDAEFATAVDPGVREVISMDWVQGSQEVLATLGEDGAFVDDGYAGDHDLRLGSPIEITFPSGVTRTFRIRGIFDPPSGGSPFGTVTMSAATWDAEVPRPKNLYSFVKVSGGASDGNQTILDDALVDFPNAKAQDRETFIDNQIAGLSSILNILYVLLALSIVVSLFGIVNTLVLTVFERTREIGMLRAIGMTRRQVRRMIRHESVITSLIGAAIGIVLGIVLAALLIARVDFIEFTFPTTQVIVFAIAAILVGILAAIFPARRAARLNPLEALHYE